MGSPNLIEALLHAPEFDSWHIRLDDSLAADADQINLSP